MIKSIVAAVCAGMLMIALPAAGDSGPPMPGTLSATYPDKAYSPYAKRSFPEQPLWGDSHLHTSLSMDAGLFSNTLPPRGWI
jgi:hypothetical protein